ncbi:MAG: pyridoxal 5'-phosphate synthase glutaminase subunit PdxT [Deltaproteobacteria bacterium]|nr:pyridoxal 5'-phosphate synthase glutaminase subunit PdxT [Deltaproteobacteria bacterium]
MIGILGLQGDVIEHVAAFNRLGVKTKIVKHPPDLNGIKGLVLPGGESTTITKLLVSSGLTQPVDNMIKKGLPTWGTCAGVILLSRGGILENVDIEVKRNAYGSQLDSFVANARIAKTNKDITMVFIRAPKILNLGHGVEVLAELNGDVVAAQSKNILLTTFHPELTEDTSIMEYFMNLVNSAELAQGHTYTHTPGGIA